MSLPDHATEVAQKFAKSVLRRRWAELIPLLALELQARTTPDSLAAEFDWKNLGPRLRQMHSDLTGEDLDMIPKLDPPKRFEVFEMDEDQRDPPPGLESSGPFGWIEVDFYPSEDSEFDECYRCFLAIIEQNGPRVAAYSIELSTD